MWFDINYKKLPILLLPVRLRKIKLVALVQSLTESIATLHYNFLRKRESDLYNLAHNSQVCRLRAVLNDKFDISLRRIKIIDAAKYKRLYIYTLAEKKPKFLGKLFLRQNSDFSGTGADFIILLPEDVFERYKMNVAGVLRFYEIEAITNVYKLAGKRYKIEKL